MYDDILMDQAEMWELVKEAKSNFGGYNDNQSFSDLSNQQRRQIAGRRFAKVDGQRQSLKDMDIRKRDYLRALVGRGTGFYDFSTARNMGKGIGNLTADLSAEQVKDLNKAVRAYEKDFGKLPKAGRRKLMQAMMSKGAITDGIKDLSIAQRAERMVAAKAGRRGLMMRGAGKAGLTAAGLGALGYGGYSMAKKSSYDPVVEMVEDLDGWEFAKEAELRAAEILLENGIDPETFEETYPESVKLASFPEPGDAFTYEGDEELEEYNDMLDDAAYDILDELGF